MGGRKVLPLDNVRRTNDENLCFELFFAVKAKDLYRVLEAELGPTLEKVGFKKQRRSRLTYQRRVGEIYQTIWFQCDKYGWDSYAGGSFFANFTVSNSPDVDAVDRREERLNYFLTDRELVRAREHHDEIVQRIPRPPEAYFQTLEAGFAKSTSAESASSLIATVRGYFEPEPIPYRRNQDFGLRYWEPGDVKGWAVMIESVLPRALDEMQSWSPHR
jgi:hypothetical protein